MEPKEHGIPEKKPSPIQEVVSDAAPKERQRPERQPSSPNIEEKSAVRPAPVGGQDSGVKETSAPKETPSPKLMQIETKTPATRADAVKTSPPGSPQVSQTSSDDSSVSSEEN
jgi:hypothetical protein